MLWVYKMVNDKMGKVPNAQSQDKGKVVLAGSRTFFYIFTRTIAGREKQVDDSELNYLLDLVVVRDKVEHPEDQICYIDGSAGI